MSDTSTSSVNSLVIKEGVLIKAYKLNRFLSVPYGIKVLDKECLYSQSVLEEVILADTVLRIENHAFEGCMNLLNIRLSPNIEYIGRNSFSDCSALTTLTLPKELTKLGFGAFNGCKRLDEITMFRQVTKIEGAAFIHTGIHTVQYRGGLADWLSIEFSNTTSNPLNRGADLYIDKVLVKDLIIPGEVTEVKPYAFYGCRSLRSVEIKAGVESIRPYAFGKCTKLKRVYLPKSVKSLGRGAFSGCPAPTITLSESLFESIKSKRCPVCQNALPYFDNQCKHCHTVFKVYEDG